MRSSTFHAIFVATVVLCLAQVAWWTIFHWREAGRLESAGVALAAGDAAAAARALGAPDVAGLGAEAQRRLVMFISEGAALGLVVLVGIATLYWTVQRQRSTLAAQERFVAGATHAWRTPLASLRLGLDSLLAGTVPEQKRERYLRSMLGEVGTLEHDVDNLLAAARTDRGNAATMQVGELRLDLDRAVAALRTRAEGAGVVVEVASESIAVRRDPEALALALQNVLDNAIKYSARGGHVEVALRRADGHAELSVKDHGVGMTKADLASCFERFVRGSGKEHAGGTGLGLWVAREIVASHGGTIAAASAGPGRGTEVVVRLPAAALPA